MSELKVVWVLGAGFSKPLGGPLLDEIFQQQRLDRLKEPYWMATKPKPWDVYWKFRWKGLVDGFDKLSGLGTLKDKRVNAEEFVELLHSAGAGNKRAVAILESVRKELGPQRPWSEIGQDASDFLAVMMHEFVATADTSEERWRPYNRWALQFEKTDEIISFNYDLVVDCAFDDARRAPTGQGEWCNNKGPDFHTSIPHHRLHGYIKEVFDPGAPTPKLSAVDDPMTHLFDPTRQFAIGVPGPGKMGISTALFRDRWDSAKAALRNADAILFMGFRFPPTDSYALGELLNAIRDNDRNHLFAHVVLGPTRSDDIQRLEALLRWALSTKKVELSAHIDPPPVDTPTFNLMWQPLWAQDFMTVFRRGALFGW